VVTDNKRCSVDGCGYGTFLELVFEVMKKKTIKLTVAEVNQLLSLLEENERSGSYSGNREHYWNRHKRILTELGEYIPSK